MAPEEILDRLKLNNAKISRKTLYNWEKAEVISAATFRNSRTAEYPLITFNEAYAAYIFTQEGIDVPLFDFKVKVSLDAVVNIRKVYIKIAKLVAEKKLYPWDIESDLEKMILELLDKSAADAIKIISFKDSLYWPKQYHLYLSKAVNLK